MRYLINSLFLLMISALSANCLEQNTGWSYIQSSEQAFYMFEAVGFMDEWDGQNWSQGTASFVQGDGTGCGDSDSYCNLNPGACDVIGAFLSHQISESECAAADGYYDSVQGLCDVCVGWVYADEEGWTTLPALGYTSSEEGDWDYYCSANDVINVKYYDASGDYGNGIVMEMFNSDGTIFSPDPWASLGMFMYMQSDEGGVPYVMPLSNNADDVLPFEFGLNSVYPNPFNPSVTINFSLNSLSFVSLVIFDLNGRLVDTLIESNKGIGNYSTVWSPTNSVSSGNYLIRLQVDEETFTEQVTFLK